MRLAFVTVMLMGLSVGCDRLKDKPQISPPQSVQEQRHASTNHDMQQAKVDGEAGGTVNANRSNMQTTSLDINLSVDGLLPTYTKRYNPILRLNTQPEELPTEGDRVVSYNVSLANCKSTKRQAVEVIPEIGILIDGNENPTTGMTLSVGDENCQVHIDKISFCSLELVKQLKPCQDFYPASEHTVNWAVGQQILFETHDKKSNIYVNVLRQIDQIVAGAQYVLFNLITVAQGDSVLLESFYVQSFAQVMENSQIDLALTGKTVSIAPNGHGLFDFTFECNSQTLGEDGRCGGDDVGQMSANLINSDPEGTNSENQLYDELRVNISSCLSYLEKDLDELGGNRKEPLTLISGHTVMGVNGDEIIVERGGARVQIRGSLRPLLSREKSIEELIAELTPLYSDRTSLKRSIELIEKDIINLEDEASLLRSKSSLSEGEKNRLKVLDSEIESMKDLKLKVQNNLTSTTNTIKTLEQGYTVLSNLTLNSVKYLLILGSSELKKCKIWPITVEVPKNRSRYKHFGCTDPDALNFDYLATDSDGSCRYKILGCMNQRYANYNPLASTDDGSCEGARLCDVNSELKIEQVNISNNEITLKNYAVMPCSVSERNFIWNEAEMQALYSAETSWDELAKLKPQEISPGETLVLKGGLDYDFMLNLDDGDAIYLEGPGYEFAPDGMILHYQWNLRKFNLPKRPDEILNLEGSATPLTNQNFSYYRDPTSGLFFWRQNPP